MGCEKRNGIYLLNKSEAFGQDRDRIEKVFLCQIFSCGCCGLH